MLNTTVVKKYDANKAVGCKLRWGVVKLTPSPTESEKETHVHIYSSVGNHALVLFKDRTRGMCQSNKHQNGTNKHRTPKTLEKNPHLQADKEKCIEPYGK